MSSSIDSGKTKDCAQKIEDSKCPKSKTKDKKHIWKQNGSWPSFWWVCKKCGITKYSK